MDEIRCKKCGLWLERPDSICPRCIAIDGSEEEKRKFYAELGLKLDRKRNENHGSNKKYDKWDSSKPW